jgi:hypothetical protein
MMNDKSKHASEAIKDPSDVYTNPDEVLKDKRLNQEEKTKVLESWALDQRRLMTSEAENMDDSDQDSNPAEMLQKISEVQKQI